MVVEAVVAVPTVCAVHVPVQFTGWVVPELAGAAALVPAQV